MVTMAGKRDYYEVLGVAKSAAAKEISDAYRKLAIKFHPDKNPGDDEAIVRFKEAAEAFEVLGDADKRARYDRYGHQGVGGAPHFNDVNDIFEAFGSMFGDGLFGDLFGRSGRRGRTRGGDIRCDVTLDLIEAAKGARKTVSFQRHERCETCQGSGARAGSQRVSCTYCGGRGQVIQSAGILRVQTTCPSCRGAGSTVKDPCEDCRGEGYILRKVRREVVIPAGVDDQMRVRLPGEGEPDPQGGPAGDCYCFVSVREHSLFERNGQHLLCNVPITYSQAALGATIQVPTLEGPEDLEVPAGTQTGAIFRMRGRGLPDPRRRGSMGDLLVQVGIEVPKSLSERQEELLRELAELERAAVSEHRKSFFEKLRDYFVPSEPAKDTEE